MSLPVNMPEDVSKFAGAIPNRSANEIGIQTRKILVNKLREHTPTYRVRYMLKPVPVPYKDVFFPKYETIPEQEKVEALTVLDKSFWSSMIVSCLLHQMHNVTSKTKQNININLVNQDITTRNESIRTGTIDFYANMASVVDGDIKTALAKFPNAQSKQVAKNQYIAGITSDAFVTLKKGQYASGSWVDQDWELFHHWIKLKCLNASDDEINNVIKTLKDKQLPIPQGLGVGEWRKCSLWYRKDIDGSDLDDAIEGIREVKYESRPAGPASVVIETPEYNSTEFMSDHGSYYHQPAPRGGCCFSAGSKIVMSDGSLKNIENIVPGDLLLTPKGSKKVLLRTAPFRANRLLYQIDQLDFFFTGSHPFIVFEREAENKAKYTASDPSLLIEMLPNIAKYGVVAMQGGELAPELTSRNGKNYEAYKPDKVRVNWDQMPDILFGIILDMDLDGISEFYVGDDNTQLLVSSELPRFMDQPISTFATLEILQYTIGQVYQSLHQLDDNQFLESLSDTYSKVSRNLMPIVVDAMSKYQNTKPTLVELPSRMEVLNKVKGFIGAFEGNEANMGFDQRLGLAHDLFVHKFALQIENALDIGWRQFDHQLNEEESRILAVTLYSLDIFSQGTELPHDIAEVIVSLKSGDQCLTRRTPISRDTSVDGYYYKVDNQFYFPEWEFCRQLCDSEGNQVDWTLGVDLITKDGNPIHLDAIHSVPKSFKNNFQTFMALVRLNDEIMGQVQFDARIMSETVFEKEILEYNNWTKQKGLSFVNAFIPAFIECFQKEFSTVLNENDQSIEVDVLEYEKR